MTVATLTHQEDDAQLGRYGYRQQFVRSLRNFESFAVAFSFISITTGIFTTFAFVLATGGPRGIWTWPIVVVGQTLVALVYGALAARVPLSARRRWPLSVSLSRHSSRCRFPKHFLPAQAMAWLRYSALIRRIARPLSSVSAV